MLPELEYVVLRDGESELIFNGVELARVDSENPTKKYWTELAIFRTAAGKYVIERIGRARSANKRDWFGARVVDTAEEVIDAMRDPKRDNRLNSLAISCLDQASEFDEDLDAVLARLEGSQQRVD